MNERMNGIGLICPGDSRRTKPLRDCHDREKSLHEVDQEKANGRAALPGKHTDAGARKKYPNQHTAVPDNATDTGSVEDIVE
jgi:hypothetical protein